MLEVDVISTKLAAIQVASDLLDLKHRVSLQLWSNGNVTSDNIFIPTSEHTIEEANKIFEYLSSR